MVSFVFASYICWSLDPILGYYIYRTCTFEFTRLIAVTLGFLFLIVNVIPHESIIFVYLTFFSSILTVAGFDLASYSLPP